jgi:hypothetical protein
MEKRERWTGDVGIEDEKGSGEQREEIYGKCGKKGNGKAEELWNGRREM